MSEPTPSYYQERMNLLGITEDINTVKLLYYNADTRENELKEEKIFRETDKGIDILVYRLNRMKILYSKEGSRWRNKEYCITRLKDPVQKANGDTLKYLMPKGEPTHPFFPPALVDKYEKKDPIPVLYLTEGYFKAFKAQMHGIDCVGLPSITCMTDRETGKLHSDIIELIRQCRVEKVVWLMDGDCRNLTIKDLSATKKEDLVDLYKRPNQFFRTIATFQELLSSFDDVMKYFAHINTDDLEGKPKGLDDLLCAFPDSAEDIRREAHSFDKISKGTNTGTFFVKMNITWSVGNVRKYFLLDSVDNFYLHHIEQRPDIKGKDFKFNGTVFRYDEKDHKCIMVIPGDAELYFRVGDSYYEYIDVPNKYAKAIRTYHRREKGTIIDDHGKEFLKHVPKYKAFCIVPDHINYQQIINNCYNLYAPFTHEIEEGECEESLKMVKHIFGEDEIEYNGQVLKRYELGLDYITLLLKKPWQVLPILCLVSTERQTGKTTFSKWLNMIFNENMAVVGNEDLGGSFNAHWASKLIICCDETKIDKDTVVERIKSLSTSDSIMINAKGKDQLALPFFGKFILLSNNEDNFINIDEEEIRFWILKVKPFTGKNNINLLESLNEEIPAFINYLNSRRLVTQHEERHWFNTKLLRTAALERIFAASRPSYEKQLRLYLQEIFEMTALESVTVPLSAITTEFLKRRESDKSYVMSILRKMGYKTKQCSRLHYPRIVEAPVTELNKKGFTKEVTFVQFHTTYYEFLRKDFLPEEEPGGKDEAESSPTPVKSDLPF